jgi:hypothetical protein
MISTAVMTMYSYWKSRRQHKQFVEPKLLTALIENEQDPSHHNVARNNAKGWLAHGLVGLSFNALFVKIWNWQSQKPSVVQGLAMGLAAGALGVLGWKTTFKVHPNPPPIDYKHFYRQLIVAHVVFTLCCLACYRTFGGNITKRDKTIER